MTYIDARLDRDIEVGAKAKPRYSTDIITTDGGFEVRNSRWRYPLFQYEFDVEPGDSDDLEEFINLFHLAGGSAGSFRFRHWSDWQGIDQVVGTGDGSTTEFQLYRNYTRGLISRRRKIIRVDDESVHVRVAGVEVASSVDPLTGIITLAAPPALGAVIAADFNFDNLVRFQDDQLEFLSLNTDLDQPVSIVLVELRV